MTDVLFFIGKLCSFPTEQDEKKNTGIKYGRSLCSFLLKRVQNKNGLKVINEKF